MRLTLHVRPLATPMGASDARVGRPDASSRVAEVHAQTRQGLILAAGFVVAAAITGIARIGAGWWLPLHLFVVGGLLSAISATTQMFAVTWSAAPAPRRAEAGAQRWLLAAGAVALVIGHETDETWMFISGGVTVIAAMLTLAVLLLRVRRRAATDRFGPAIDAYAAAIVAGAVGMSLGVVLGTGRAEGRAAELRLAHLLLNVFGLVGLVIAGSLPYFTATQVRSRMSRRASATAMRFAVFGLALAIAVGATGAIIDRRGVVAGALVCYALGLVAITVMLPIHARERLRWAGPRVMQLLCGLGWWVAMTVALAVVTVRGRDDRAVLQALVLGGFAQILVASLAYLGPVLRGGGHQRLTAGFAITRSWVSLVAGNVAALAAATGRDRALGIVLVAWLADVVVRAARLLTFERAARSADAPTVAGGPTVRSVAVPTEHGGWSLTLEPVVLGLLVAWSIAGLALGVAAMLAFLARTPLKLVLVDRWRGRWLERTRVAARVATVELLALLALVVVGARGGDARFWLPLVVAAPLVAIELWFDMRSRGRRLLPELAGTVGMGSVAAAIALAGGAATSMALGLWVVVAARAAAAIPYARTQVFRTRGRPHHLWHSDLAQAFAAIAAAVAWLANAVPLAATIAILAVAVHNAAAVRATPRPAKVIGFQQMFFGIAVVVVTAVAVAA